MSRRPAGHVGAPLEALRDGFDAARGNACNGLLRVLREENGSILGSAVIDKPGPLHKDGFNLAPGLDVMHVDHCYLSGARPKPRRTGG